MDINAMTLDELNEFIRKTGGIINKRYTRLKSTKQISEKQAKLTLKYLKISAKQINPSGFKTSKKTLLSTAKSKNIQLARQRAKKLLSLQQTKTSLRDIRRSNILRRSTFGTKLGLNRALTDEEMTMLGNALAEHSANEYASSQIVDIFGEFVKSEVKFDEEDFKNFIDSALAGKEIPQTKIAEYLAKLEASKK